MTRDDADDIDDANEFGSEAKAYWLQLPVTRLVANGLRDKRRKKMLLLLERCVRSTDADVRGIAGSFSELDDLIVSLGGKRFIDEGPR
jgi:hypothetical protein